MHMDRDIRLCLQTRRGIRTTYERRQAVPLHSAPRFFIDVDPFSMTFQEAYDCPNTLDLGDL
jgi:hypothetical protein